MKVSIKSLILGANLVLLFHAHSVLDAQARQDREVRALKIGDTLPNIVFQTNDYSKPVITLSELKGKAVILDFWSTGCGPCIEMIPKLQQLEQQFPEQLVVLSISAEDESVIKAFFRRRPDLKLLSVTDSSGMIYQLFPHQYIPHYVWIDPRGVVRAITNRDPLVASNIRALLDGASLTLAVKKDSTITLDDGQPFLIDGNGGNAASLIYHSVLSRFDPGLGYATKLFQGGPYKDRRVLMTNVTIPALFRQAFGAGFLLHQVPREQTLLEVSDLSKYELSDKATRSDIEMWGRDHLFSYELIVPEILSEKLYDIMQDEIRRLFGLTARMEKRKLKVLALVKTDQGKLTTLGGKSNVQVNLLGIHVKNSPLAVLQWPLQVFVQQSTGRPIVYEGIDLTQKVDLDINANLTDLAALRAELKQYGLDLRETERDMDVLVIRETAGTAKKE